MARPCKLSDDVARNICEAVKLGQPLARAAVLAGVAADTVRQWLQNAAEDDGTISNAPFVAFARRVEAAVAYCENERLKRIRAAGRGGAVLSEKIVTMADGTQIKEVKRAAGAWQADCLAA